MDAPLEPVGIFEGATVYVERMPGYGWSTLIERGNTRECWPAKCPVFTVRESAIEFAVAQGMTRRAQSEKPPQS